MDTTAETAQYQKIPLSHILPSPHQARKQFDPERLRGLAESMKQEGLIQAITVRIIDQGIRQSSNSEALPSSVGGGAVISVPRSLNRSIAQLPMYELISGERRVRAAKLLGWEAIDAKVITTVSDGEAAAKGLVENLQREDLNPIEEAEGFAELQRVDPKYWTQSKIAEVTGRSQGYISQSLRLLALPEEVVQSIRAQIFSRSHGLELARLPSAEMQREMAKRIPGHLTWEETRRAVTAILSGKNNRKVKKNGHGEGVDPLAGQWPSMLLGPEIANAGSWGVTWGIGGWPGWRFSVLAQGEDPRQGLAGWFRAMADHLEKAISVPSTDTSTPTNSHLPSEKELDTMAIEFRNMRLPQTPAEQAEVEALAASGPAAVYAWIYGKGSVVAKQMKLARWSDLGVADPTEGARTILTALKRIAG